MKTNSIMALVAIAALSVLVPACTTSEQNKAEYPVDKIEFQKNGFMSDADAKLLIGNAKRSAALQVYLWSLPRISMEQMKIANREMGINTLTMPVTEDILKPSTIIATANQSTIYLILGIDFDTEPLVIEYPNNALGYIDDGWQRSLYDGIPDGTKAKPIFIVPLNYKGEIPSESEYTILRPKTATGIFLARGMITLKKDLKSEQLPKLKHLKSITIKIETTFQSKNLSTGRKSPIET
jgi:hypothetical protein